MDGLASIVDGFCTLVKLGQGYSNVQHIARQAHGLYNNLNALLPGAINDDIYEPINNTNQVRGLVIQIRGLAQEFIKDATKFGVSAKVAARYKAQLIELVNRLSGLIQKKRYLSLLSPLNLALQSFIPEPIGKRAPKMVWQPIGPGEPEEPELDIPLPPGLGLGRTCPAGTPQRVCDLGYWPVGYGLQQHRIEKRRQKI